MRILFLQKRLLLPANTGGKIRTLNVLRHLARWHEVTYLCNLLESEQKHVEEFEAIGVDLVAIPWDEPPRRSARFIGSALKNLLSPFPLNVDKDFDSRLRSMSTELVDAGHIDLLVCDFVQMARNCIGLAVPKLLFQHNVEAEIFERLSANATGPWAKYLGLQAKRMRRFEGMAGCDFDRVVAVSKRDQQQFQHRYDWNHVGTIDTAVDIEHFRPNASAVKSELPNCVFVGSMDWTPNREGVLHFASKIWPSVKEQVSDATFTIVGRNPPSSIQALTDLPGVEVTGTVDDTRPYLERAWLSVVPLYCGGGTRLKIFEAMAMGCPVLSTPLGAEGLEVDDGKDLELAESDEQMVAALTRLFGDDQQRAQLSHRGQELVRTHYSPELIAKQFDKHCHQAVEDYHRRTADTIPVARAR